MTIGVCPRCQQTSYETLRTHVYCSNCNYSPDLDTDAAPLIPGWAEELVETLPPLRSVTICPLNLELGLFFPNPNDMEES